MKKLILGSAILLAIVGGAPAADLPAAPITTKAPIASVYDWSGVYFGGHVGGGWARNEITDGAQQICAVVFGCVAFAEFNGLTVQHVDSSGFLGGIQAGANYQIGKLVVGAEADFSWAGINGSSTVFLTSPLVFAPGQGINRTESANTNWIGTVTTRIGIAHDRWMLYGKFGGAWAHTSYADRYVCTPGACAPQNLWVASGSETRTGWTAGTGVEWAFWDNWSAKLEYDYINFGARTINTPGTFALGPAIITTLQNYQVINEVKFGLNYRFMPNFW